MNIMLENSTQFSLFYDNGADFQGIFHTFSRNLGKCVMENLGPYYP